MRHIGDCHDQTKAAAHGFGEHGVVEIACILAVDRDQRQLAQIDAAGNFIAPDFIGRDLRLDLCGFAQRLLRPFVRQAVAGDRHFHDQRWHQPFAEHAQHLADRTALRGRRLGDLGDHDLAGTRAAILAGGDQDLLMQAPIIRRD